MDATHISPLVDIYANMTAGAFPLADGADAAAIVRMQAEEVLQAPNVHIRMAVVDNVVYYLACNSRALASSPGFATALAVALPDHPAHNGDGCYFMPLPPNYAVAVVKRGPSLKLYSNLIDAVEEACAAEDLPKIDAADTFARPLSSQAWVYRQLANRAATITSMTSLAVLALCAVVILASNAASGYLAKAHGNDLSGTVEKANAIIAATPLTQPLAEQMNRVQSLSVAAVSAGGWIDGYNFKPESGERFVISLPAWVSQDTVKTLGDNTKTEAQPNGNLIWVLKKDQLGAPVKNRGPAAVPTAPGPSNSGPAPAQVTSAH